MIFCSCTGNKHKSRNHTKEKMAKAAMRAKGILATIPKNIKIIEPKKKNAKRKPDNPGTTTS